MNRENIFVGILAAGCLVATFMLMPSVGHAEADPRVTKSMETLKAMTAKLGAPKLEGNEAVGGKGAPTPYSARPRSITALISSTPLEKRTVQG
jgi:hypothetical protein